MADDGETTLGAVLKAVGWPCDSGGLHWCCWPWMVSVGMTLQGLSIFCWIFIGLSPSLPPSVCPENTYTYGVTNMCARLLDVIRHANRQIYHACSHTLHPHTRHCSRDRTVTESLLFQQNRAADRWIEGGLDTLSPLPLISLLIATN